MRITRVSLAVLLALLLLPCGRAQEKPAAEASNKESASAKESATPPGAFRVQVILTEFDGANKLSSLPYMIPVATSMFDPRSLGSLRVGIRIPVEVTGSKTGENSIQYIDIGSNIDVRVKRADTDRYTLELTIDRSSLYVREQSKDGKPEARQWAPGDPSPGPLPLVHEFRCNVAFIVRDGHAAEATLATDPITGHTMKAEVTLSVLK